VYKKRNLIEKIFNDKMETNDDADLDRLIQEELDALSLDEPIDDVNVNEDETKETTDSHEGEEEINETRRILERDMRERLAAFENEINSNFHRYEIDYSEIDELLQKPVGGYENEIQSKVAQNCGIEREELDRVCYIPRRIRSYFSLFRSCKVSIQKNQHH